MTRSNTNQNSPLTIGVDIGGTKITVLLMNRNARIIDAATRSTDTNASPEKVVQDVAASIRNTFPNYEDTVSSAGLGVAGTIDRKRGIVQSAPNLGWNDVPLASRLSAKLQLPVHIANDVDAATYGEWKHGAGQGVDDLIGIFLGTGIGTGVITGGRLLESENGSAAELGHVPVIHEGRSCTCGYRGCVEAYAGGWALGEIARERVREHPENGRTMVDIAGSVDQITARTVSEALEQGDDLARELVQESGKILGTWATGMVNAFHPKQIVIGGSVGEGIPVLGTILEEELRKGAFDEFATTVDVVESRLGNQAVAVGAAALSLFTRQSTS